MKKQFLLLLLVTFYTHQAISQCPGCVINSQCGVGINPIEPTQCPAILPDATVGVYYDEDVTFFMPRNFDVTEPISTNVQLNSLTVTGFNGMPSGLNFTCNIPGCSFTITSDVSTQRGCAKICGTPTTPGNYVVLVSVVANVTASGQTLNQPSTISIPIRVNAPAGCNPSFCFNPPSECGQLTTTFTALVDFSPNQPTSYQWTFDNGNTSTEKNPPAQTYTAPGQHFPRLVTTVSNYVLTEVSVTASGTNWCGDAEEISLLGACQGAPDIYFTFTNASNSAQSQSVSNNLTATWNNLNNVLENPIFSLQFWDDDNVSQDDNLGVVAANITGPGTFNFTTTVNGNQQAFGTYTISLVTDTVYDNTDTVEVFPLPEVPLFTAQPNDSSCLGDSILLAVSPGNLDYFWFQSNTLISDSTATFINTTGYYKLMVVDPVTICSAVSDSFLFSFVPFPQSPVITVNTANNSLQITNNSSNFQVTWFENGIEIPGETGNTLSNLSSSGPFSASFTSSVGCTTSSFPLSLCLPGNVIGPPNDTLCCGELEQYLSQGFVLNQGYITAWAVTPESFGPVTNANQVQEANDAGYVFLPTGVDSFGFNRVCFDLSDSIAEGNYFITPFIVEAVDVPAPLVYDTLQGCRPYAFMCPVLTGEEGWSLNPMLFTFPDGSQLDVNQSIAGGLNINEGLVTALGGLPCINLMNLYLGNPNGPWSISATNNGTGTLNVDVPAFQVINSVDSCSLITEDQVYTIEGVSITLQPGQTATIDINIPPIPGGFPSVVESCSGFAIPHQVYFKNCYPNLTCTLKADSIQGVNVTTFGGNNGFVDVKVSGGTPPYQLSWSNGNPNEDLFNVPAGSYTLFVSDANGCKDTLNVIVSQPSVGFEERKAYSLILFQNIPNPADEQTTINFFSQHAGKYSFELKSIEGRVIFREDAEMLQGLNSIRLNTSSIAAGLYEYSVSSDAGIKSRKLVIEK